MKIQTKPNNLKDKIINDSFDPSYSNEIQDHLNKVSMDAWSYIYSNYIKPTSKKVQE